MAGKQPTLNQSSIETLSRILESQLTHQQLPVYLQQVGLDYEGNQGLAKWKIIYNSFAEYQTKEQCSNAILNFIKLIAQPQRFLNDPNRYKALLSEINEVLSFISFRVTEEGILQRGNFKATTIHDAKTISDNLKSKLKYIDVHPEILAYCTPELLNDNYFHAVFEASKGLAERIRQISKSKQDGHKLFDEVFGSQNPKIRINAFSTETERNEQSGLLFLTKGIFSMIRNPTAHEPKIHYYISEQECIERLITISLVHRKLDNAALTTTV